MTVASEFPSFPAFTLDRAMMKKIVDKMCIDEMAFACNASYEEAEVEWNARNKRAAWHKETAEEVESFRQKATIIVCNLMNYIDESLDETAAESA